MNVYCIAPSESETIIKFGVHTLMGAKMDSEHIIFYVFYILRRFGRVCKKCIYDLNKINKKVSKKPAEFHADCKSVERITKCDGNTHFLHTVYIFSKGFQLIWKQHEIKRFVIPNFSSHHFSHKFISSKSILAPIKGTVARDF